MDLGESLKTRIEAGLEAAVTKYFDRDFDGHVTVSPNGHGGYAANRSPR